LGGYKEAIENKKGNNIKSMQRRYFCYLFEKMMKNGQAQDLPLHDKKVTMRNMQIVLHLLPFNNTM
jgi:hypothetical protein